MKTSVRKSDIYFISLFVVSAIITFIAFTSIWKPENRFSTFWYTFGFIVLIELLLFLKPVVADKSVASGAFWIPLFTLNFIFSAVALLLLLGANIVFHGRSPWVQIITLTWVVIFLFISGIFVKTADADSIEETADNNARQEKLQFIFTLKDCLSILKQHEALLKAGGAKMNNEVSIVEKLASSMSPSRTTTSAGIDVEISGNIDSLSFILKQDNPDAKSVANSLEIIKNKLRMRESLVRKV